MPSSFHCLTVCSRREAPLDDLWTTVRGGHELGPSFPARADTHPALLARSSQSKGATNSVNTGAKKLSSTRDDENRFDVTNKKIANRWGDKRSRKMH